jgi:hypothetical protein
MLECMQHQRRRPAQQLAICENAKLLTTGVDFHSESGSLNDDLLLLLSRSGPSCSWAATRSLHVLDIDHVQYARSTILLVANHCKGDFARAQDYIEV